ncbi:hypothetical protein [Rhizobium phage RHph_X2_26]|nr:hypothetical protein [Rhizobium phage RHph_X2_26]
MSKYNEYKLKAAQLDKLMSFLADSWRDVDTITIGGERYRLTKAHNGAAMTIEPFPGGKA